MEYLKRPFTWLLVAEVLVVGALGAGPWHVFSTRAPAAAAAATGAGAAVGELPARILPGVIATPRPAVAVATPSSHRAGPTPGLDTSPAFLGSQLKAINRDETNWERGQWAIVQAGLSFARAYIEGVVLPAIRAAEAGAR